MKRYFLLAMIVGLLFLVFVGCDTSVDSQDDESNGSNDSDGLPTEPLTGMEQELVGKWRYYHAYDDTFMYNVFNADRTGCGFDTYSGTKTYEACYTHWELRDEGEDVYSIVISLGSGNYPGTTYDGHEYHYIEDELWRGGYSNLVAVRYTDSFTCDCASIWDE